MADEFEARLLRLFDEPPALGDGEAFARRIEARLDRGWGLRQVLIGVFGFVGGLIGALQMVRSGMGEELEQAAARTTGLFTQRFGDLWRQGVDVAGTPLSAEVMWMAAALGVMALAFAVTRAVEEF